VEEPVAAPEEAKIEGVAESTPEPPVAEASWSSSSQEWRDCLVPYILGNEGVLKARIFKNLLVDVHDTCYMIICWTCAYCIFGLFNSWSKLSNVFLFVLAMLTNYCVVISKLDRCRDGKKWSCPFISVGLDVS
jgi:hypothetical protein